MTRFSDAALLKGNFAHMATEFRAGDRSAPGSGDWQNAACDNQAEEAAQEVAKHIFALQQLIDETSEKLEISYFTNAGPMKVMALVPGEGDVLRIDGMLETGDPVSQVMHASQISLTFTKVPLDSGDENDDGLEIGFLIFRELEKRQKERNEETRKSDAGTKRIIKPKKPKNKPKDAAAKKAKK